MLQLRDKAKNLYTRQIIREINVRASNLWITLLKYFDLDAGAKYHILLVGMSDGLTNFFYLYLSVSYVNGLGNVSDRH